MAAVFTRRRAYGLTGLGIRHRTGSCLVLDWIQWPAMAVTIGASWLIASSHRGKRHAGFWMYLLSNGLWIAWGLYSAAPALIVLQLGLAAMNVRGALKSSAP